MKRLKRLQPRKIRSPREIHVSNFRTAVFPSWTSLERPVTRLKNRGTVTFSSSRFNDYIFLGEDTYDFFLYSVPNLVSIPWKNRQRKSEK